MYYPDVIINLHIPGSEDSHSSHEMHVVILNLVASTPVMVTLSKQDTKYGPNPLL